MWWLISSVVIFLVAIAVIYGGPQHPSEYDPFF
jgi:hypothetical protein